MKMRDLFASSYGFTAVLPDSSVLLNVADTSDTERIAALYRSVKIDRGNYKSRFDPEGSRSFSKAGGMLIIQDEETLGNIFNDSSSSIVTARQDGRITASLWISSKDPAFGTFIPDDSKLKSAMSENRVLYLREIIVTDNGAFRKLPLLCIYTVSCIARELGFTHSIAEIYKISSFDDGEAHELEMLNERSFHAAISAGGTYLGELPRKTIKADGFNADIASRIISFDYDLSLSEQERRLKNYKIAVERGIRYETANQN